MTPGPPPSGNYSPLKMLGIICLGLLGVVVMLSVLGDLIGAGSDLQKTVAAVSGKPIHYSAARSGVTMQDFLSVRTGMSLGEVTGILGSGSELSRSDIAGYSTVMYGWKNRNGSNMNVMLQNGSVVSKAQYGLR